MGYKLKEIPYELKVGRDLKSVSSLHTTCMDQESQFDFILIDICHAMNFRTPESIVSRDIALSRSGNHSFVYLS